jgi:hypothetical protein
MSEAWRVGVPVGLGLFLLALAANVPYFLPGLSDQALLLVGDGVAAVALLTYFEAGRAVGRRVGQAWAGALAGGIAGFVSSWEGTLQHALLTASPGYGRLVRDLWGAERYATMLKVQSGAGAMAGILGSVLASVLLGVVVGLIGGAVGRWAGARRWAVTGGRKTGPR